MGTELVVGAIMAAVGAAGSAYSAYEQKKSAQKTLEAQEKMQDVELASQNEQAARERRSQIREARIKRAMVENTAANAGQTSSSAAIVGGQSATQYAAENIGNINTAQSFATSTSAAQQNIYDTQANGTSIFGSLAGSVGGSLMSAGISGATASIFKDKPKAT